MDNLYESLDAKISAVQVQLAQMKQRKQRLKDRKDLHDRREKEKENSKKKVDDRAKLIKKSNEDLGKFFNP